jgi:hypothetical protein
MKVCFVETANSSPHLETSLEVAKNHLNNSDEVDYHFIGYSVPFSEFVDRSRIKMLLRAFPEVQGAKLLASDMFRFVRPANIKVDLELPGFNSIEELKKYEYKSYRAGLSALSSLVSFTRTSSPCLARFSRLLQDVLISGISVYEYCIKLFSKSRPDLIYLFNGRFANNRAILDAARTYCIPTMIHERGANKDRYYVKPFVPHDLEKIKDDMLSIWNGRIKDAESLASKYFVDRRNAVPLEWPSFVTSQQPGQAQVDLAEGQRLVSYFSSCDDEFLAVDDFYNWTTWTDQLTAVRSLIQIVSKYSFLRLIIRLHPHLAAKAPSELNQWLSLELPPNCSIVHPNDKTDTYALIDKSDLVITSGSTVGIESVFWNTPSICLGPSLYSHLGAVYLPSCDDELESLLLKTSVCVNPQNALPYGYYMSTHGEQFLHYKSTTLFEGEFMGVNLQSYGAYGLVIKARKLMGIS